MEIPTLVRILDQPQVAADHLSAWGLRDAQRGQQVLLELADTGISLDLLASVCRQLADCLPRLVDPDEALGAFGRFFPSVRSPLGLAALLERDPAGMPMLLSALALGPRWTNYLIADPEAFDLLRQTEGQAQQLDTLRSDLLAEVAALADERAVVAELARFRQRHLLRIAWCEVAGHFSLDVAVAQLADVAEALIEAALAAALEKTRDSKPRAAQGKHNRLSVIAVGDLGARQPNHALPLDLLVVYEATAPDAATLQIIHEHVDKVAKLLVRLLNQASGDASTGPVRLVVLPDSPTSAAAHSIEDVIIGFDSFGRTWHRQQMLKARPIAGDRELGQQALARLESWLFRRYLNRADETGIKALKRRILVTATLAQDDWRNVRLGRGGLRDIESTVELLQLLVGGDQPLVRTSGTLAALASLTEAGTILPDEHALLETSYLFLRRLEHRLQILLGPENPELPVDERLLQHIAAGYSAPAEAAELSTALKRRLAEVWQIIQRLLGSAFPEEGPQAREVDLLLDPAPPPEEVRAALSPFGFAEPINALATLNHLATEQVAFLSTRRCRHLLATSLPRLLCAVGATPHPDRTLGNLARVSDSLGGKGVLWELFRFNPPTLDLYVKLCAASPYLSDILTTNPGMIDELVDSLQLDKLPARAELQAILTELCRGAVDTLPILHDFKNAQQLRIGVRDILGKEDIDRTHAALADVAETCLTHVAEVEYQRLVQKYGTPTIGLGPFAGERSRLVIVALSKLGGREPNYHSQLDVLFFYEAEGTTTAPRPSRRIERTANNHFFTQLAQRIIKQLGELTAKGRLYAVDVLLRPIGVGGALAMTLDEFQQHFTGGGAPLWHWQALCQARPVFGEKPDQEATANLIQKLLVERTWSEDDIGALRRSRLDLERGAETVNLKRGAGGTLDVEFLVQMLQLKHAANRPDVLRTNTQAALAALADAGAVSQTMADKLGGDYQFLRNVESALRLLNTTARHDLPIDKQELAKLALLLGHSNPERLRDECLERMAENRALFDRLTAGP